MKPRLSFSSFQFLRPLARMADRLLPFVSYRLASAIRIRSRSTQSGTFHAIEWWTHAFTVCFIFMVLCLFMTLLLQDVVWAGIGVVGIVGYPVFRYQSELRAAGAVRDQVTYDLPEFVQILVIYLYAGLTVSRSIQSIAERWRNRQGPLPDMIREASGRLSYQTPLTQVLHQMADLADTNDMKTVVTILLTHTTRGGDATIDTLLDISKQMWNKRLSLVRKKAEETTVKLIFPLMLIFVAILLIVGAPAVMFVGSG